jgi:ATP-binding cassette subfamily C protein
MLKEKCCMENIKLKGGEMYISKNSTDTYRVYGGAVLVYIVHLIENEAVRRTFIYEANIGEVLPSFNYVEEMEDMHLAFAFVALEKAELEIIANGASEDLQEKFAKKAKIICFDEEGFEQGLAEQYNMNIVKEDAFIHTTKIEQKQAYENSLNVIYNLFHKKHKVSGRTDSNNLMYDAVAFLCRSEHIDIVPIEKVKAGGKKDISVNDIASLSHFMCRSVTLPEDWYKLDLGALIVYETNEDNKSKKPYACVPKSPTKYWLYDPDPKNGGKRVLKKADAIKMSPNADMIYRPFKEESLGLKEIVKFALQSIKFYDVALVLLLTFIGSVIGLLLPVLNQKLYDDLIPIGAANALMQICFVILACEVGNIAFSIVNELSSFRMESRIIYDVQSATYNRLFNLPESFLREYDSADLGQRALSVSSFVSSVLGILFGTVLSGIFSFVYLFRMFGYSRQLTSASVIMMVIYAVVIVFMSLKVAKYSKETMEIDAMANSKMYQFVKGIAKIRIAGVEDRALYEYLKLYTKECGINMKSGLVHIAANTFGFVSNCVFTLIMYYMMIHNGLNISMGSFIAFSSAFGLFSAAMMEVVYSFLDIFYLKPLYERIKPILETKPEFDNSAELPGDLSGDIELSNVTFSYSAEDKPVLNDLSLHIKENEYVGIVGSSGCGKSTLFKLLLGFERPQKGKVYYDGKDIENIDKRELRKKMGVVLQDGRLISGSIYENITITAPNTSIERVNEVLEDVGLMEDVYDSRKMPMGVNTLVDENSSTISGGQRQRILIARAIVGKPKILLFDEATSALDNNTQAEVCRTLKKLDSTKIVIAHRLSTVKDCDRIIVMDGGNIVEEGNYEELMAQKGRFFEMASRQIA